MVVAVVAPTLVVEEEQVDCFFMQRLQLVERLLMVQVLMQQYPHIQ